LAKALSTMEDGRRWTGASGASSICRENAGSENTLRLVLEPLVWEQTKAA